MMRLFLMFLVLIFMTACARAVDPTVENINKIFSSQDFTFESHNPGETPKSISFRVDYLVYKSDKPTIRRGITYDEVLQINDFIQKIVNQHQVGVDKTSLSYYVVKNTAYTTTIIPQQEDNDFDALLKSLDLIK